VFAALYWLTVRRPSAHPACHTEHEVETALS
jgi:hypothetical protein